MFPAIGFQFPNDVIDILAVAFVIYQILLLLKGTRAFHVLTGLVLLAAAYAGSQVLNLLALNYLLNVFLSSLILVVVILFQNDIRRALAQMGKHPSRWNFRGGDGQEERIEELVRACGLLAGAKVGALIAVERATRLRDHVQPGLLINGRLSSELLVSIFMPTSPIHDGAVIVGEGKIVWAGCFLPLTVRTDLEKGVGTRHRAALGLTEETDAVAIVVSEERGTVSIVVNGRFTRDLDGPTFRKVLTRLLTRPPRAVRKRGKGRAAAEREEQP